MKGKNEARQEVKRLLDLALEVNQALADRYVKIARDISMKFRLRIPREYKKRFCKHCYKFFKPGNYRVRTKDGYLVYYCHNCKKYMKLKINKNPSS